MKQITYLVLLVLVISCQKKAPEPTELYNTYRKSIALIQSTYYFQSTLDNGLTLYYTLDGNDPIIYDDEQEAIENASTSFGTGFFISQQGELATNRHVIYPVIDEININSKLENYISDIKYRIGESIIEIKEEKSKIVDYHNEYYDYLDYDERNRLKDEHDAKADEILQLENLMSNLTFDSRKTVTELKRVFLGIAFDDTHVTGQQDFEECVALKKSDNVDYDLAIIQLKNKTTPSFVSNILSLENIRDNEKPKINDDVYMIGFNHGFSLASTDNGIKSQFTHGTITQDPDNKKMLYSIPTLPGSSGSPIIDKWGNLVAINYAKTGDFQGFSFGVPSGALVNLIEDREYLNSSSDDYSLSIANTNTLKSSPNNKTVDYSDVIRNFLIAEESRDLGKIFSYFSPKCSRYYDLKYPTNTQLKNRYEYLWGFTSNPKNHIQKIEKINDYTYDLKTRYTYYNQKKAQDISVESVVRFLFNSEGKIIETYGI